MKIGLIAGEASGDKLGAALVHALKLKVTNACFEGVVGPHMHKAGVTALGDMEQLAVMGIVEPLKRLPSLWRLRKKLIKHWITHPPDVFIGIDAPDFNLGIANTLKKRGIKTVQYVSPSIWAWRAYRIHKIKRAIDLMLTQLPFENKPYIEHGVPVCFVGHPFADTIICEPGTNKTLHQPITVALMPGSRDKEIEMLGSDFLATALHCYQQNPKLKFVMPLMKKKHQESIELLRKKLQLPFDITYYLDQTDDVLKQADIAVMASGTATLEALLHKVPMVIAYRVHPWTAWLAKKLLKVPFVGLPNLLAGEKIVSEYLQENIDPKAMAKELLNLTQEQKRQSLFAVFTKIHLSLKQHAADKAANAVLTLLRRK